MQHSQNNQVTSRRKVAYVNMLGTTQLHLRNPWIIAWWSAAFPGLGHLLLCKYLRGFSLLIWEMVVNYEGHINQAIFYSCTGEFNQTKLVLDKDWMLLYFATFIFAIWDSYRTATDINNVYTLAAREDTAIGTFSISALGINYLDKRSPLNASVWSALSPGMGQLYTHQIITAAFILIWWIINCYMSKLLPAIHYSFLGQFEQAKTIVDIHWLMNIPSIYMFSIYDAYTNTVENNELYDWEQSKFLKRQYQYEEFPMPVECGKLRSESMYIIAAFEYNHFLERAVTGMQMKGVSKEHILAAPLDKRGEERRLFDTIHSSDGLSLLDFAAALGTICMLFGSIYGFILAWGPIVWGLIGLFSGFAIGLIIKLFATNKYANNRAKAEKATEVVLIIACKEHELEIISSVLWDNHALGISKLNLANKT
jgi:hypothetical protein